MVSRQEDRQARALQLEVDLAARQGSRSALRTDCRSSSSTSTDLALRDASERLERIEPDSLARLLLDLGQERDDLVDHPDDGLLELAVPLGEDDDGRIEGGVVAGLKGELCGGREDRRG